MQFRYSAKTKTGERVDGTVEAESKADAIQSVERLGRVPISLTPAIRELSYIICRDHPSPAGFRHLVVFDPHARTVQVAFFKEIAVHDALKNAPIKHTFELLWENKGSELGDRLGSKVPGVGAGGVLVGGWLAGSLLGGLAQGLMKGVMPEDLMKQLRQMPPQEGDTLVEHILKALPEVKTFPMAETCRSDSGVLGHTIFFPGDDDTRVHYDPNDVSLVPNTIQLITPTDSRYRSIVLAFEERKSREDRKLRLVAVFLLAAAVVAGLIAWFIMR